MKQQLINIKNKVRSNVFFYCLV